MKKIKFLIAALLAVSTFGFAGCNKGDSGNGAGTDELQPRTIITEDSDVNDTENGEDKNELKPPRCEGRMPHVYRRGGRDHPVPGPMPRPERGEK